MPHTKGKKRYSQKERERIDSRKRYRKISSTIFRRLTISTDFVLALKFATTILSMEMIITVLYPVFHGLSPDIKLIRYSVQNHSTIPLEKGYAQPGRMQEAY
jgi:hypothetical protein